MRAKVMAIGSLFEATPAPAQVLLAVVSIQLGAAVAIDLFSAIGPSGAVFCRLAISALLLILLVRPKMASLIRPHYKLLLTYGATLCAMNWFFFEAIARIPLGLAVTIEFMGPLAVGVLTSRRWLDLLWTAIAVSGLLILAPDIGDNIDRDGVLYAVVAGIGWGGFVILSKRVNTALPGNSGLAIGMMLASVFILPFAAENVTPVFFDIGLAGNVMLLAVLSTTIPFYLEFSALKKLSPQTYGILITMEPAVAATVGAFLLGDVLGVGGVIAIACVTVAAIGATLTQKRATP